MFYLIYFVISVLLAYCTGKPIDRNVSLSNDLSNYDHQVATYVAANKTIKRWDVVDGHLLDSRCRDCYRRCNHGDEEHDNYADSHEDHENSFHAPSYDHHDEDEDNNEDHHDCEASCRNECHGENGFHGEEGGHNVEYGDNFHGDKGFHGDDYDHNNFHENDGGNRGVNFNHEDSYHGDQGDLSNHCRDVCREHNDEEGCQRDNCNCCQEPYNTFNNHEVGGYHGDNPCCCQGPCSIHDNIIHDCHHECPPIVQHKFGNWQNDGSLDKISHHCAEWDQGEFARPPLGVNVHPNYQSGANFNPGRK